MISARTLIFLPGAPAIAIVAALALAVELQHKQDGRFGLPLWQYDVDNEYQLAHRKTV